MDFQLVVIALKNNLNARVESARRENHIAFIVLIMSYLR